jgi:hypothetical protein
MSYDSDILYSGYIRKAWAQGCQFFTHRLSGIHAPAFRQGRQKGKDYGDALWELSPIFISVPWATLYASQAANSHAGMANMPADKKPTNAQPMKTARARAALPQ